MRRPPAVTALLLAACLATGCDREGEDMLTDADVTAIRQIGQDHARATLAGETDRILAMRADDIVWMPPNAPIVSGKDAVRQFLAASPPAVGFTITPRHTEGSADLAYDRGAYVYSMVVEGDTVHDTGKYLVVLRRQPDNSWLIAAEMWSSDAPPPVPAPPPARRRA